ncbi:MAG: hypothetical protein AVDCRST_MAG10-2100, partial [uncultured Acidimicrobiales bacterium]
GRPERPGRGVVVRAGVRAGGNAPAGRGLQGARRPAPRRPGRAHLHRPQHQRSAGGGLGDPGPGCGRHHRDHHLRRRIRQGPRQHRRLRPARRGPARACVRAGRPADARCPGDHLHRPRAPSGRLRHSGFSPGGGRHPRRGHLM